MFVIERLIDIAAGQFGFDRVELRRANLIPPSALPYANPLGMTYDSGDYERCMDRSLALADWHGFSMRRREARRRGRLRGIGLANYIEATSGSPREYSRITVVPEGRIDVVVGTLSSGQGHETSFAQCVAEWLGVPTESIRLIQGDTDIVPVGGGSHSGRSMRMAGIVMGKASDLVIVKAKRIAGHLLETDAMISSSPMENSRCGGPIARSACSRSPRPLANVRICRKSGGPAVGGKRPDDQSRRVPIRQSRLRGRDRPGNGRHRNHVVCGGRRRRPRRQSADPAWADPWRHRPGRGASAVGAVPLRSRKRSIAVGVVHGLRDAARVDAAILCQ